MEAKHTYARQENKLNVLHKDNWPTSMFSTE